MTLQSAKHLTQVLRDALTERKFLKRAEIDKSEAESYLQDIEEICNAIVSGGTISCTAVCSAFMPVLNRICREPAEGWLKYLFEYTLDELYPERDDREPADAGYRKGRLFLYEAIHAALRYESSARVFSPVLDFEELDDSLIYGKTAYHEYRMMLDDVRTKYIYEFMRIGAEITPFNTVGHIAGVHFTALHVAKQLAQTDVPIDLALVSAAAASHDIGKYGCKDSESGRIPHLHYYYTNDCLTRNGLPLIAHIASNHSTWDLELENLSVENLILIYADFRVKSRRENGVEIVEFHSLKDSFDIILNKLENVDEAKKNRYIKVYNKLKDFEDYMESLGVNTDFSRDVLKDVTKKDAALCTSAESVERLKYLAIEHNIEVMSRFNSESAFGDLIEDARTEKNWKNTRAYLNILEEYYSYMTQSQKEMTIYFLFELLSNREGDIRRQAATLAGRIIAKFDDEYRKDLPDGVKKYQNEENLVTSKKIWRDYLLKVIYSDLQTTEQQRRWIGYTLKITISSLFEAAKDQYRKEYLSILLKTMDGSWKDELDAFIVTDTLLYLPLDICGERETETIVQYVGHSYRNDSLETKIAGLRFIDHLLTVKKTDELNSKTLSLIKKIAATSTDKNNKERVCVTYLRSKIEDHLGSEKHTAGKQVRRIFRNKDLASDIFRENLKIDTEWIMKCVNIELLLDSLDGQKVDEIFHVATHLSNLLKVSERVTVRHSAGEGLLELTPLLPLDQRNELAVELTKGLEIGEYQFSKYIPEYLGRLSMWLHPNELDEVLHDLGVMIQSTNDRVASVTLDTLGVMLIHYDDYLGRFGEDKAVYSKRKDRIIGLLLKGMANYHAAVSQEAFMVIGHYIFASREMTMESRFDIFRRFFKKMLTLIDTSNKDPLTFFNNAASLNHIYRFISGYIFSCGEIKIRDNSKVAFFPGTFDPFSLSHKGIVTTIRDLGYDVYLALDEFSWSKKTQPRMIRRNIIAMSVANEANVYIFPDEEPINIANEKDIARLKRIIPGSKPYIVVGSDVIANASSYKMEPTSNSIHSLNHIVFRRESNEMGNDDKQRDYMNSLQKIKGEVVELTLPTHLEDISSTRIRENIDANRDISVLIDSVAQNYIYDNGLYLREPQYKFLIPTQSLKFTNLKRMKSDILRDFKADVFSDRYDYQKLSEYIDRPDVLTAIVRDIEDDNRIVSFIAGHPVDLGYLYEEFGSQELANRIRENARGRIFVMGAFYGDLSARMGDSLQVILTEAVADALRHDYSYMIYHPVLDQHMKSDVRDVLERQGFREIEIDGRGINVYAVDMKNPVFIFNNMDTVLKDPFDKDPMVLRVIDESHRRLQRSLTRMYPDSLVLSINSGVMHHKLIKMITEENGVPFIQRKKRKLGPYMCVPFGKILKGIIVPNTVTKTLHTQKNFTPDLIHFTIEEYPYYASIENQVKTLKSFNRPVILVDDLLHKGYRMRSLNPVLNENGVEVRKLMVGLLSGRGKDLMTVQGRKVDSVYFTPNLKSWFVESSQYPFIGGDGVKRTDGVNRSAFNSINLILPYVSPSFLKNVDKTALYDFSMVTLENTRDILMALEEQYQNFFHRKLTLQRLSEAVISPMIPDVGTSMEYDMNKATSDYLIDDIEELGRLKGLVTER